MKDKVLHACDQDGECLSPCKTPQTNTRPLCRLQQNGLEDGIDPPAEQIPTKYINVNGRVEHEAIIKDASKCKELGLDQVYETIVYLNRWGNWLGE